MSLRRITFIRPNMGGYRSSDALPPLSLAILAARTPPGVDVVFYDDKLEEVPMEDAPDLAVFTVETFTARRAYSLADRYRARGIPVVMGGYHPTLLPEEVSAHADAVVCGDAEGVWEQLLVDAGRGGLQPRYEAKRDAPLTDVRVDRTLFKGKRYPPLHPVQHGRGCRFSCDFCSIHAFYKKQFRHRPLDGLVREIEKLPPRDGLFFVDDNLYSNRESLIALLETLRPLRRRWSCQISIDVARDEALLNRMAGAGCFLALIGFESFSPENLRQMGKSWNRVSGDYAAVVRRFHERGMAVYGTFVFGYDHDDSSTLDRALNFALSSRLDIANFNPLTPTPGTPLYDRLDREGRLRVPGWWNDPNYRYGDPIFNPKRMGAEELNERCFDAKKSFYRWGAIGRRMLWPGPGFDFWRMGLVGLANVISRREIYRKQHRYLGEAVCT